MKKVQIVIMAEPDTASRLDVLRIATQKSRARVAEEALLARGGLPGMERAHPYDIARVHALAERAGMTWREYAAAYAKAYQSVTFGPGLEALEADDSAVTGFKPGRSKEAAQPVAEAAG